MCSAGTQELYEGNVMDWLPSLLEIDAFGGNWNLYLEAVYNVFQQDFCYSPPQFFNRPLNMKRYPISNGKEATFWHMISDGDDENSRIIDLRRCERIGWPKPVIVSAANKGRIRLWSSIRSRKDKQKERRWLLSLRDFSYVVILADRKNFLLPWTAFCVEYQHRRDKLRKEWEIYLKEGLK